MPFLFIVVGLTLMLSALNNTQSQLTSLVKGDFSGQNNFVYYLAAIGILGALQYIDEIRPFIRTLMGLVLLVMFLKNGGIWQRLTSALQGVNANSLSSTTKNTTGTEGILGNLLGTTPVPNSSNTLSNPYGTILQGVSE